MITILFFVALLPWAIAQTSLSQNVTTPILTPTLALQSPGTVTTCQLANITWVTTVDTNTSFTINYTNVGAGDNVTAVVSGVATVVTYPSVKAAVWRVNIPKSGHYILTGRSDAFEVSSSDPFAVTVSDTSCFNSTTASTSTQTPSRASSSSLVASLVASATSSAATDPSVVPVGNNRNMSKVTTIVGTVFGSAIFVALLAAIFFYRRHRSLKTQTHTNSKPEKPKGHRTWGGLPSVDSTLMLEGVHTLPHTGPQPANSPDGSIKSINHFGDTFEKGKSSVHEEETPADEMPAPFPRSRTRYSNGSARLARQDSGLAAFNTERARTASLDAASASPATPLGEDPFHDNLPRLQGLRSQSFSASSAVHGSPHSSNLPNHSSPLTQEGLGVPRISETGVPDSAVKRSKSASTTTRPVRKPVPRYDPSIEMRTTPSVYSHHSAKDSTTNVTSDSHTMLGSSVESTSPWLDRAPSVNRNIGLAFQGDGPVHYLLPDMPPPMRN